MDGKLPFEQLGLQEAYVIKETGFFLKAKFNPC